MAQHSNPRLAKRVAALRPTAVNAVLREAAALQAQGKPLVSLMRGQPDTPTPPHIIAAAERALRAGRTGYADNRGEPGLRQAVAEKLAQDNALHYSPADEILITDGATCGLFTALAALVEPGDDVLVPDPSYDAYAGPIAAWGGRAVAVAATLDAGRFTLARASLEAACTPRARVLLLNTPWNPAGTVLTHPELQTVVDFAADHNLSLLSDEIYEAYVYDGRIHVSPATLGEKARARTVLVNSLSKTYAMTGWRVGYSAGPAEVIAAMALVLAQFSRGPATFVQDAAACALSADQQCVRQITAEYQGRRDQVVRSLNGLSCIRPLTPDGGLFVLVDVRRLGLPSDRVRRFLLEEAGVVVIHGSAYGPAGEGTLRVSFAAGGAVLEEGLTRLRAGLERLQAKRPPGGPA
jgi:aspartate aminotransferase